MFVVAGSAVARADDPPAEPPPDQPPAEPGPDQPAPPIETPPPPPDEPHDDDTQGPLVSIEAIAVRGNTATQTELILRALPIAPGDVLHASDKRLANLRFKVLALGFFLDAKVELHKGSERGQVIVQIDVIERGTITLNRLWFGTTTLSPYWVGADVGERNLLGLGVGVGAGVIYADHADLAGARAQWAGELRASDGSLFGTRWGANGSLTLVHGSEAYRVAGTNDTDAVDHFDAFPYRRFGGRANLTYDWDALTRLAAGVRFETIDAQLPEAPTQVLPDGRSVAVDLHVNDGHSRVATLGFTYDRDTRPDPTLPHAGGRLIAAVEVGNQLLGSDYDFATFLGRYEHWWPLREGRHAIGVRLAGGGVVGRADRFDRIHVSDVDRMLTPRALGLVLSTSSPLDLLRTRPDKPEYGDLGGSATVEYAMRVFRGTGKRRLYGGDVFFGAGLWGLAEASDLQVRDTKLWDALPIDLYLDAGVRVDTDIGIFELTIANGLGRLR